MSVDPFLEAIRAELETDGALTVYDSGQLPVEDIANTPYCVIHAGIGVNKAATYDGAHRQIVYDFQINSVGVTAEQARWAARKVCQVLLDKKLDVEGYNTGMIAHPVSTPVDKDVEPASRQVYIGFDKYKFSAWPKKKEGSGNEEGRQVGEHPVEGEWGTGAHP